MKSFYICRKSFFAHIGIDTDKSDDGMRTIKEDFQKWWIQ